MSIQTLSHFKIIFSSFFTTGFGDYFIVHSASSHAVSFLMLLQHRALGTTIITHFADGEIEDQNVKGFTLGLSGNESLH